MADSILFNTQDGSGNTVMSGGSTSPKMIKFAPDYDGTGKSRRVYKTDGTGASTPLNETVDYVIFYTDDPRFTVTPPEVIGYAQAVPFSTGDKTILESDMTSGSVDLIDENTVIWFVIKNTDGSFNAIGTMKVQVAA